MLIISAISTKVIEISSAISSSFVTFTIKASTITDERDREMDAHVPLRAEDVDDPLGRVVERVEEARGTARAHANASSSSDIAVPWS